MKKFLLIVFVLLLIIVVGVAIFIATFDANKYKPHITLVYTFEVKDQEKLYEHIKKATKDFKQINLKLKGLQKSKHQRVLQFR